VLNFEPNMASLHFTICSIILGAFAELRKATISIVMPVCLPLW